MRKFAWLVPVVALAFAGAAFAEDAPKKEKAAKQKPAKLVADPAEVDMGDLKAAEEKDVTVKIKNEGEKEAKKVACKGAGFKFEGDPAEIAGGADKEFKGKFTAPKKAGKKDKITQIKLTCGKVNIPITLMLKAAEAPAK